MPKSRSPHGIQFDSPLQRQWMIRSSSGSDALKAATGFGASSSSQPATKRIPAATTSSTSRTYRGRSRAPRGEQPAEADQPHAGDEVEHATDARDAERRPGAHDEREPE